MKKFLGGDEWTLTEVGFDPQRHKSCESLFSLGNGHMGQRANFEETYSGPSLKGQYIAGIYYPDKTKVGWWKNGYPEYYAKVLNAPGWIDFSLIFNGLELDLHQMEVTHFVRELDMKKGLLRRHFIASWPNGQQVEVRTERFVSMVQKELGCIRYQITPLNFSGHLQASLTLDGDVRNADANYREKFWNALEPEQLGEIVMLHSKTKITGFEVSTGMTARAEIKGSGRISNPRFQLNSEKGSVNYDVNFNPGDEVTFYKYATVLTSRDHPLANHPEYSVRILDNATERGYYELLDEHSQEWERIWDLSDIEICGDLSAQQGIRFGIFQLKQTYTGHDPRLNIGPKGFTGEKYGGSTYWDTEAYCLPFYLNSDDPQTARNLLIYRYNHLEKAIDNASKLGFKKGAALYPMVTMNGEECHNEWEITFEEIHRNGAIAYAIYNYIRHTGDKEYLLSNGLEVLIAISRFWAQRVNFSAVRQKYVILGVTGPNEYENNVNNNWYTNYIAIWSLNYTLESLAWALEHDAAGFDRIISKTQLNLHSEIHHWQSIVDHMFLPEDKELGIFLQQDGYLDKEQVLAAEIPSSERPVNQNWSWDRILRSCLIKQSDVLQGLYFFEDHFDQDTLRRNFQFYEPRTVHESSLSSSVHAILAAKLGMADKAYELYLRTSRLDLDDYNDELDEGCHITSMAGTWLTVIEGFGGMRLLDDGLSFDPLLPAHWESLSFQVQFRRNRIHIRITSEWMEIRTSKKDLMVTVKGTKTSIPANSEKRFSWPG